MREKLHCFFGLLINFLQESYNFSRTENVMNLCHFKRRFGHGFYLAFIGILYNGDAPKIIDFLKAVGSVLVGSG